MPHWPLKSTRWNVCLWIVALTLIIELITVFCRFSLGLESTRDTAATLGRLFYGIRIHHGYLGCVVVAATMPLLNRIPRTCWFTMLLGAALVFSDLAHHFLVLWPLTGDPQFHLVYPPVTVP